MLSSAGPSHDEWAEVNMGRSLVASDFAIPDFQDRPVMKILAFLVSVYAPLMLLIHVSTEKILTAWNEQPDFWIRLWFPPQRELRAEGTFWLPGLCGRH
jgi:hypothetical protein